VEPRDAVRIDAAQIRRLENGRSRPRVLFWDADVTEDVDGELEELLRLKELSLGHRG
jgi:hypothetical protein